VTAPIFRSFWHTHGALLGSPVTPLQQLHGYAVQIFAYGALVYNQKTRAISLLPLGDRVLEARHYLPSHPGNAYPSTFAPASVLRAIGW
jgi:hypothetical protein